MLGNAGGSARMDGDELATTFRKICAHGARLHAALEAVRQPLAAAKEEGGHRVGLTLTHVFRCILGSGYPTAECFHIVGFGIAIGTIALVNLSLFGAGLRRTAAGQVLKDTDP